MRARIVLVYLAIASLWGSTWSAIRIGLADLPPLTFAGTRMALAAAILAPIALRGGALRVIAGEAGPRIALVGAFQIALPYGLMFVAQQWVPSSLAAILFASFPVWIALLARALLPGERLTPAKLVSAAIGVLGIVVVQLPQLGALQASGGLALGSALIVLASIVVALANVLVRRHLVAVSPLAMTAGQTAIGAAALLAAAFLLERGRPVAFTPTAVGALLYLAVFGTALTYIGLYWLVPRVPIAAIGAIPLLDTTVAVSIGALWLAEPITWHLAAGGAMVLAATGLASRDAG
ncbi:MAG TPA: DMT family transporter [Anaeromyxobacter sp.]|nr:DMT family transporter [Anaeromyxobacter sp.]